MTKEKIKIEHIKIKLFSKEFSYYMGTYDKDRVKKEKEVYNQKLEEFRKSND